MSRLPKLLKLLELSPADAFVLYGIAQEHAKAGEHARAVEFYDRCLAADPAYCYAYYHKAVCQRDSDDAPGARVTLQKGLRAANAAADAKAAGEMTALLESLD